MDLQIPCPRERLFSENAQDPRARFDRMRVRSSALFKPSHLLLMAGGIFFCLNSLAQCTPDFRWATLRWQGKFTITTLGSGTETSGSTVDISNFETASFDKNLLLGTTVLTNNFATVYERDTYSSCLPISSKQLVRLYTGSGPIKDLSIEVTPDLFACTYDLTLNDNINVEIIETGCEGGPRDTGSFPYSPSLAQFVGDTRLQGLAMPPFGQPLAGQISETIYYDSVPVTSTFSWNITALNIVIESVQTPTVTNVHHSFISTDPITIQALISPAVAGVPVEWTVTGLEGAAGLAGFPTSQPHDTDSDGRSTFTFVPSDNTTLVKTRQARAASGSTVANLPIAFDIVAGLEQGGIKAILSQNSLEVLEQDETDMLRQEYVDIQQPVPARTEVVPSLGSPWNKGNYTVQLDNGLRAHFNAILGSYRGRTVMVNGQPVNIPADAQIVVTSAFRSPQLNRAIGSVHPESLHTRGRALDLQPLPVTVLIDGQPTALSLHQHLYFALADAVSAQGLNALPEQSAIPVPLGDSRENHIHVQW